MRSWITIALCVISTGCGGSARRSAGPAAGDPSSTGSTQGVEPFWDVLAVQGARWELLGGEMGASERLVAEVVAVEPKGDHTIVELRWTLFRGGGESEHDLAPSRIAISPRGIWFVDTMAGDELAAALRDPTPPAWQEPPVAVKGMTREDGKYVHIETRAGEKVVCLGDGPAPGAGECDDVCYAELCVAEKSGVVGIEGLWAPDYGLYENQTFSP